jgi:hypothetical protein
MSVRVLSVTSMPYQVQIWVEDCDDGRFNVHVDERLIDNDGAKALQKILNTTITGWARLDNSIVRAALHAVTG